ncbi:MAG: hypothetical protein WC306_03920, partial [Candidatus Paceibacterota bacterium]
VGTSISSSRDDLLFRLSFDYPQNISSTASWAASNDGLDNADVTVLVNSGTEFYASSGSAIYVSSNFGSTWTLVTASLNGSDSIVKSIIVTGSIIYVGTSGSGMYISTDNGTSWTSKNGGQTAKDVYSVFVSASILVAAVSDDGIYLTSNSGSTWTAKNSGLTNTNVKVFAISGSTLIAGTSGSGIFVSTDSGQTWIQKGTGISTKDVRSIAFSSSVMIAGTVGNGVLFSTSSGNEWALTETGLTGKYIQSFAVSDDTIYAAVPGTGVHYSSNKGFSWINHNYNIPSINATCLAVSESYLFVGSSDVGFFYMSQDDQVWTQLMTGSITSSNVTAIAVVVSASYSTSVSGSDLYVGTSGSGVFYCAGYDWSSYTSSNAGLTNTDILSLAISSSSVYAGTNGGGVFVSTDTGSNWTAINNGLTNSVVTSLAISGTNILAGTSESGVFLTTDGGANWAACGAMASDTVVYCLAFSRSAVFAATNNGVYLSTDVGTNWSNVNTGLYNTDVRSFLVTGSQLYAGTYGDGVFLSINNGATWTPVNVDLTSKTVYAVAATQSLFYAGISGSGVYSSQDGKYWTQIGTASNGLANVEVKSMILSGTKVFVGTYDGVFASSNSGSSWQDSGSGLPANTIVNGFAISGSIIFAATQIGVYSSSINTPMSWSVSNVGLTNTNIYSVATTGSNIFVGTPDGVFLSSDVGVNWKSVNSVLLNTDIWALSITGSDIYAGVYNDGIYKTPDTGSNWIQVGTASTGLSDISITSIAISGANIFAGTNGGGVFHSSNSGQYWTPKVSGLTNLVVKTLAISGTGLFAGTADGIFLTVDTGSSWTELSTGLTDTDIRSIAILPRAAASVFTSTIFPTNLFVGTPSGVFISTNDGSSWASINSSGLTNTEISSLAVYPDIYTNIRLYAGTSGSGVFLYVDNISSYLSNEAFDKTYVSAVSTSGWSNASELPYHYQGIVRDNITYVPSNGYSKFESDKVRIESNWLTANIVHADIKNEVGEYDTNAVESNRLGIFFSPSDLTNEQVISYVGPLSVDDMIGTPDDWMQPQYDAVESTRNFIYSYVPLYSFYEYLWYISLYNKTVFDSFKDYIPAYVNPTIGVLIESDILDRDKIVIFKSSSAGSEGKDSIVDARLHVTISGDVGNLLNKSTSIRFDSFTAFSSSLGSSYTSSYTFNTVKTSSRQEFVIPGGDMTGTVIILMDANMPAIEPVYTTYTLYESGSVKLTTNDINLGIPGFPTYDPSHYRYVGNFRTATKNMKYAGCKITGLIDNIIATTYDNMFNNINPVQVFNVSRNTVLIDANNKSFTQ